MKCSIKMRYQLSYHLYKTLKNPTFVKKGTFFIFFKLGLSWVFCIWFQTYFRGSLSDYQRTLRGHFVWWAREPLRIRGLIWFSEDSSDFQRTHLIFRGLIWFSEAHSDLQRLTLIFRGSLWSSEAHSFNFHLLKKCPTNNQTGSNWKVDCSYWKETPPTQMKPLSLWKSEESSENQMSPLILRGSLKIRQSVLW